jgi:hypothetical protein
MSACLASVLEVTLVKRPIDCSSNGDIRDCNLDLALVLSLALCMCAAGYLESGTVAAIFRKTREVLDAPYKRALGDSSGKNVLHNCTICTV